MQFKFYEEFSESIHPLLKHQNGNLKQGGGAKLLKLPIFPMFWPKNKKQDEKFIRLKSIIEVIIEPSRETKYMQLQIQFDFNPRVRGERDLTN